MHRIKIVLITLLIDIKIRRVSYIFYQIFYTFYALLHDYMNIKYEEFEKQCKKKIQRFKTLVYGKIINKIKNRKL